MGSGGSDYTSYGSGGGGYDYDCKGPVRFLVIIDEERYGDVWEECNVNDSVEIEFSMLDGLPILEVFKIENLFKIGMTPAQFGFILKCINNGWVFAGKIIKKSGNRYNVQITVELWGTR